MPKNNNFDLDRFGPEKFMWAASNNVLQGHDEEIVRKELGPNPYYILVKRVFPTGYPDRGGVYTITVTYD